MRRTIALMVAALLAIQIQAFAGTYEINIAIHTHGNEINEALSAKKLKELVEERTKGDITVNYYPSGQLGTEMENIAQIKTGEIECALLSSAAFGMIIPDYEAPSIPYAFPSSDAVKEYWDGPVGAIAKQELQKRNNILFFGTLARGPRMLTANRAIPTPAELKGLKIRVPEIKSWITVWHSMGALPTPVNLNETYTALQTRVVEAQENPIDTIFGAKFHEVQTHTMLTEHVYAYFYWCYNQAFFERLPKNYQDIVTEATAEALAWGNSNIARLEQELIAKMVEQGNIMVKVDKPAYMEAAKNGVIEAAQVLAPEAKAVVMKHLGVN